MTKIEYINHFRDFMKHHKQKTIPGNEDEFTNQSKIVYFPAVN